MPAFPSVLQLSSLDGKNGFRIDGVAANQGSGWSVSGAGDVNGDGVGDLIVGAPGTAPNSASYVVFGTAAVVSSGVLPLSSLDGTNGFRIDGVAAGDGSGWSVSDAGDVNGDGVDDLIVGAWGADPNGSYSGASYVVFGTAAVGSAGVLQLSALNGKNGFRIDGVAAGDRSGYSVSDAGDVNGDGVDDLIVGARYADPNGSGSGASYVVFGTKSEFDATLQLSKLDGTKGFRIDGVAAGDNSGRWVSGAGDVNGDGVDDLIVGALYAAPNGTRTGASYVVFGTRSKFDPTLQLSKLDGTNGFRIDGVATNDQSGRSVSGAGDVNGDGVDDLIVGSRYADPNGSDSGASYVVFGTSTVGSAGVLQLSKLDGKNGFRIDGVAANDISGAPVSSAGDVNGDGVDDLIIGARGATLHTGASYVVFGTTSKFDPTLQLSTLDGTKGLRIAGVAAGDFSGRSISGAGDVNGDGVDDLIVGAPYADPNGSNSGASYVVFGIASNKAPGAAVLSTASAGAVTVAEHKAGSFGTLSATDPDSDPVTFSVVGDTRFTVGGTQLQVATSTALDFERDGAGPIAVTIRTTDSHGASTDTVLSVTIADVNPDIVTGTPAGEVIMGGTGKDVIAGGGGDDSLFGGDGDDALSGDAGADFMFGGKGDDRFVVDTYAGEAVVENPDEGTDVVYARIDYAIGDNVEQLILVEGTEATRGSGNGGDNVIIGNSVANLIYGLGGNDSISGGGSNDSLIGGDGDDNLDGGIGADQMIGGIGNDSYVVDDTGDVVDEDARGGTDTVYADIDYALPSNVEQLILVEGSAALNGSGNDDANTLIGNSAGNLLYGNGGDDTLYGQGGDDTLLGHAGRDILAGGAGDDTLLGGTEADIFYFSAGNGKDRILDFNSAEGDKIMISTAMAPDFAHLGTYYVPDGILYAFAPDNWITIVGATEPLKESDFLFY